MIENRKEEHIRIAEGKEVNAQHNFWDDITLIHRAMPEVDYDSIKTDIDFLGNQIDYPMIISSMTGGIVSGDDLMVEACKIAKPDKAIFLSDVDGVFD